MTSPRSGSGSPPRFTAVPAPQMGQTVNDLEHIEKVVAYWPDFHAWEVHVMNDRGHIADTKGNRITRMVRDAGFGDWVTMPER